MSAASVTFNAIASDADFVASDLSHANETGGNFQKITKAINIGALDSNNYSESGFLSQHVGVGQVNSINMSSNAVVKNKIAATAIQDVHLQKPISDGGVRAVRIGPAAGSAGVKCAMFSKATQISVYTSDLGGGVTRPLSGALNINFTSDTINGNPSFTATPTLMGQPVFSFAAAQSAIMGPPGFVIVTMDSVSVDFAFYHPNAANYTVTAYVEAAGVAVTS